MSEVTIHEDRSEPGGGYAVIRVSGVAHNPGDAGFSVRRIGYDRSTLGRSGWQGPDARLYPMDVRFHQGSLYLKVGPDVVDRIEVGTPIEIEIPSIGVRATLHWPEIAPSVAEHGPSRRTRTGFGARSGAAAAATGAFGTPEPAMADDDMGATRIGGPMPDSDATQIGAPPGQADLRAHSFSPTRGGAAARDPIGGNFDDPFADFVDGDFLDDRWDMLGERRGEVRPTPARDDDGGGTAWIVVLLVLLLLVGGGVALVMTGVVDPDELLAELGLGEEETMVVEAPDEATPPPTPIDLSNQGPVPEITPEQPIDTTPPIETAPPPERPAGDGGFLDHWMNMFSAPEGAEPAPPETVTPPETPPETPPQTSPPERPPETAVPTGPPLRDPRETPTDYADRFLRSGPAAEAAFEEGNRHLQAGDAEVAVLMFEYGADRGHAPSLMAIGRMYDPVHFSPSLSAFTHANPVRAAERYREAEAQGSQEAAQALADLRGWLERAAAGGDQEARAALQQLDAGR